MRTVGDWIGPVIGGAVGAGVLWSMVNSSATVNGVGFLERQGWPWSNLWLFVGVGAALGVVWGLARQSRHRAHGRDVAEVSQRLGFVHNPSADGLRDEYPELARMPLFKDWASGENRMTGRRDGQIIEVFDLTTVQQGEESQRRERRTVVVLPGVALPDFDLRPRTLGLRLLGMMAGLEGITFDPTGVANPDDARAVEEFNRLHVVAAPDIATFFARLQKTQDEASAHEAEQAVRQRFTPGVMRALARYPGWSAQSCGGRLALWRGGEGSGSTFTLGSGSAEFQLPLKRGSGFCPADKRPELVEQALAIRDALVLGAETDAGPAGAAMIPPRADHAAEQQGERLAATMHGGIAGLFGGAFVGMAGFASIFFRPDVHPGPWLIFLMFPLFVGGAGLGAVGGAWIGSRMHAILGREGAGMPPATPKQRAFRRRALMVGGVFGMFLGFFAGGIGGGSLGMALHLKPDHSWITPILFFGGAGLGLFTGAMLGLAAVLLLSRKVHRSGKTAEVVEPKA